jgi:hypothetical protein
MEGPSFHYKEVQWEFLEKVLSIAVVAYENVRSGEWKSVDGGYNVTLTSD